MDEREIAIDEIIEEMLIGERKLNQIKHAVAKKYKIASMIKNSEILEKLDTEARKKFLPILKKRPMRTLSGVTPVAVMIKPEGSCPYNCIYCPTGLGAKSYTGYEPAAMRARQENFDPKNQVVSRLTHYTECGHATDKCEIIVMGGTFLQMPSDYKRSYIKGIFDGLNGEESTNLEVAKLHNETTKHRAIGLTIETRPDVCGEKEINEMLDFGATRVELGVQHPDDKIYSTIQRGHTRQDVILATKLLKDSAFKLCYHLMPGLPGSNKEKDIEMVKEIFSNPDFRPDMLKIYPTLVMPETKLQTMMDEGNYKPYSSIESVDVISEFYRYIPNYVRVMRIMRDIPASFIGSGATKSNLRELVEKQLKEKSIVSKEIRSREVGLLNHDFDSVSFEIKRTNYDASGGKEIFLSIENEQNLIAGFLRLRIPNNSFRPEIDQSTSLVRELHVYGGEVKIGKTGSVQHKGVGTQLLETAERISKEEYNIKKILVISGVGARVYYRRLGYKNDGPYVSKLI